VVVGLSYEFTAQTSLFRANFELHCLNAPLLNSSSYLRHSFDDNGADDTIKAKRRERRGG
jgi:hypothetical protein